MPKPYFSITSPQSEGDVEAALGDFTNAGLTQPNSSHRGMLDFLDRKKRHSRGYRHVANRRELARLTDLTHQGGALPMIHYELYRTRSGFADNVSSLVGAAQQAQAIQLNGDPSPEEVRKIIERFNHLEIVYQIRKELLAKGVQSIVDTLSTLISTRFCRRFYSKKCGASSKRASNQASTYIKTASRALTQDF